MEKDRNILILYATAVCNLKCTYCFIDKNPALVQIDNILDESFKGDYYLEFAKEVFPDPNQVTEIQIWGGEPTLNFHRIAPTIKSLLQHYPRVNKLMFSTNLAHDKSIDEIFYLLRYIKDCQPITLSLQLSLDGPTFITDANRGKGTTEKFTYNFSKLISGVNDLLNECTNLTISAFNKSTLNIDNINYLQTKERIISYYQFLELFAKTADKTTHERFHFDVGAPNTACPLPITKQIGLDFANLCKLCREIEAENEEKKYFKYFTIITPFVVGARPCNGKFCNQGACGSGKHCVGLLPNRMISTCHNGFTEVLGDYKKYAMENKDRVNTLQNVFFSDLFSNDMVFPFEKLSVYEVEVEEFYNNNSSNAVKALLGQIQFLAVAGQINKKYLDMKEAMKAVLFITSHTSLCIRDNLNTSGTKILYPPNLLKLLLNGAREYIEQPK